MDILWAAIIALVVGMFVGFSLGEDHAINKIITETHEVKEDDVARLRRLLKSFGGTK